MSASIAPRQLQDVFSRGEKVKLLDVRTPAEFREMHIPQAVNVPLEKFDAKQVVSDVSGVEKVFVICWAGSRGETACRKLADAGLTNVVNVAGGTKAWEEAGLPVVRGRKTMSLERQVRIAAGTLVLSGVVLSLVVHPYFVYLSGFVGAGLIFAGITNTCGMGMLLARMPWNQVSGEGETCSVPKHNN